MTKQNTHDSENRYDAEEAFRSAVDKVVNTLVVLMMITLVALAISSFMDPPVAKGDDCPNGVCPQRYAPSNTVIPSRARAPEPFYSNYPRYRYWYNPYINIQPQKKYNNKPKSNSRYRRISDTKDQQPTPATEFITVKRVDFIKTHTVNVIESTDQGNTVVDSATVHVTQRFVDDGKLETVQTYGAKVEVVFRGKEWWLIDGDSITISTGRTVSETATIRKAAVKSKNKDA